MLREGHVVKSERNVSRTRDQWSLRERQNCAFFKRTFGGGRRVGKSTILGVKARATLEPVLADRGSLGANVAHWWGFVGVGWSS